MTDIAFAVASDLKDRRKSELVVHHNENPGDYRA